MSLQSDFELCLKYAELVESKQAQQQQAQNNIAFMHSEAERLKGNKKICTVISIPSAVITVFLLFCILICKDVRPLDFFPILFILIGAFAVSFFIGIKIKKEYDELEDKKPILIQQYVAEVDDCEREINRLIQEIHNENLFDIVPADYFSAAAIAFCLSQVRKKLANTPSEAFQQLDAEIKHLEHMEYLEQMNNARIEELNRIKRAIQINTLVRWVESEKYKR